MLETLDHTAVRRWSVLALQSVDRHRAELDAANVFPVADSDTGTNLAHTLRSAAASLAELPERDHPVADGASAALRAMSRGAVLGARGNSGVILSQVLRGLADGVEDRAADGPGLVLALRRGAERAYASVAEPVEGTMLSVVRASADACHGLLQRASGGGLVLPAVVAEAVRAASLAVARTPEQLPELARAGVVDAGGRGVLLILDALADVVGGAVGLPITGQTAPELGDHPERRPPEGRPPEYEVHYLLDADPAALDVLRGLLLPLGDSLVLAGTGGDQWSVHVHVADVGAAIEAGVSVGRPHHIRVTRFADTAGRAPAPNPSAPQASGARATTVVTLAAGAGLAALFTAEGARVVPVPNPDGPAVPGDPTLFEAVLAALRSAGPGPAVVLPDSAARTAVVVRAVEHARESGVRAAVVPTASAVQGLAALAVHDPARRFEDDVIAMAEAAAATRWAQIVHAREHALTSAGACEPGDVLGLIDGDVVEIGRAVPEVTGAVLDRLLRVGGELVTVVIGEQAPAAAEQVVREQVARREGLFDLTVFHGGPVDVPVLIGIE